MKFYKSVVISEKGPPNVLKQIENELREPLENEVRIKIICTGVGFTDVLMRYGHYIFSPKIPFVPGYEIVGIVDKLGEGVTSLSQGQLVAALTVHGGYAEYIYLPSEELVSVPENLDPKEALSLILNYVTAYQMLFRVAKIKPGQTILITGASGGVGNAILQLGKNAGLKMYGTASKKKHALVTQLGGIPIDYHTDDFMEKIKQEEPDGIDAVFDAIGWRSAKQGYKLLRRGGALVSFGQTGSLKNGKLNTLTGLMDFILPSILNCIPDGKRGSFYGITGLYRKNPIPFREDIQKLFELLEAKKLKPVINKVYPLSEAVLANEILEKGEAQGKLVLQCNGE
ncbi:medium chain dehydrogenase/reductase family protein [Reinekea forsetii]|nr:medium chain dehydrogenase/reductase family protein [Reinekea forsetii]